MCVHPRKLTVEQRRPAYIETQEYPAYSYLSRRAARVQGPS
jgi:hypothetical protein